VLARADDRRRRVNRPEQPPARVEHDIFAALILEEHGDLGQWRPGEIEAVFPRCQLPLDPQSAMLLDLRLSRRSA
jgi:hypothetical protein